jgi:hypothetical protein
MDKNTCNKGLGYMTKGWLWGWSLMTTCGDVWYIHHSYNVYLIRQAGTPISLKWICKGKQGVTQVCRATGVCTGDMGRVIVGGDSACSTTRGG